MSAVFKQSTQDVFALAQKPVAAGGNMKVQPGRIDTPGSTPPLLGVSGRQTQLLLPCRRTSPPQLWIVAFAARESGAADMALVIVLAHRNSGAYQCCIWFVNLVRFPTQSQLINVPEDVLGE